MSNGHTIDRSTIVRSITVHYTSWPDNYWKLDLRITDKNGDDATFCVPLFSGVSPIKPTQVQETKHLLCLALETITMLDTEVDPF
jgi:hypothetical protein